MTSGSPTTTGRAIGRIGTARTDGTAWLRSWAGSTERVRTPEELERLSRLRAGRVVDRSGYVRFRDWRLYRERGLAKKPAAVWICGETITLEHDGEPLSQFTVQFAPDKRHLTKVRDPRLFETRFASPQPSCGT